MIAKKEPPDSLTVGWFFGICCCHERFYLPSLSSHLRIIMYASTSAMTEMAILTITCMIAHLLSERTPGHSFIISHFVENVKLTQIFLAFREKTLDNTFAL